jgi:hypothetical protein
MAYTNHLVIRFFDPVRFRNHTNCSIEGVLLRGEMEPLLVDDYITCRSDRTVEKRISL